VADADVLVESFSDRVLPNLGYPADELRRLNPRLRTIAVRAFPASSWVAFGRGVHAASGLGMVAGAPVPALLAYPDPLAGLVAFTAVMRALADPEGADAEISLAGAIAPLLARAGEPLGPLDRGAIAQLSPPGPMLLRER
jgi:crotonobetainyl-CoA:carnitine CoA-transferase CaiB-like acyl-CoA transferase